MIIIILSPFKPLNRDHLFAHMQLFTHPCKTSHLGLEEVFSSDVSKPTYDLVLEETSVLVELTISRVVTVSVYILPARHSIWKKKK